MKVVVASASGLNGNGYGKFLAFSGDGAPLGTFSDDVAAFPPDLDGVGAPIRRRGIAPLPRGLRFDPNGLLHCVAEDSVVVFDYDTGRCHGAIVRHPRLNGLAIEFFGY